MHEIEKKLKRLESIEQLLQDFRINYISDDEPLKENVDTFFSDLLDIYLEG